MKLPKLGSSWMLFAALGFSIMGVFVKIGAQKFSSAELVFYRSLFGLLAIYSFIFTQKLSLSTPVLSKQFARAWVGFASLVLFFYALSKLPLATAITLNYTSPLFLAVLMPILLREKPKKWLIFAIGLGFFGMTMLLKPTFDSQQWAAGGLGLLSGLGAAFAYIHVKQLGQANEPDWRTVFYFTLISTIAGGFWLLWAGYQTVTLNDLPILIGLGLSATLAQLAMTRAYRTGNTLVVGSLAYATVVLASLFGVIIWNEQLSVQEWFAIILIIISGLISLKTTQTKQ